MDQKYNLIAEVFFIIFQSSPLLKNVSSLKEESKELLSENLQQNVSIDDTFSSFLCEIK